MECKNTRRLMKDLGRVGVLGMHPSPDRTGNVGWPDRYLCWDDGASAWSGWVEFKEGRRRVTKIQRHVMGQLVTRGVPCWVVRFEPDHRPRAMRMRLECPFGGESPWPGVIRDVQELKGALFAVGTPALR